MKLAVFVSGRGSNLRAIVQSNELKNKVEVAAVISDKSACGAFEIAEKYSIPCFTVSQKNKDGFSTFPEVTTALKKLNVELIVLAGFLKLIPADFVAEFRGRIINIHPALLPSFGGKGMYGINVHRAVFASSAKVSGPTVHFIDDSYDTGRIIAQRSVDISNVSNPEEIAKKVLEVEHEILPYVIGKIADGKIVTKDDRVIILE